MNRREFPTNPSLRRAILVLDSIDIERAEFDRDGSEILKSQEVYVADAGGPVTDPIILQLAERGLFRPGVMLLQSPFDPSEYEDIGEATRTFALQKHTHFSTFCQLLGARDVNVIQVDIRLDSERTRFAADAGIGKLSGQLAKEKDQIDAFCSRLTLHDVFAGGAPDLTAAADFLASRRLSNDANMRSLLDMRRPGGNPMLSRDFSIDMSSETRATLKALARTRLPNFLQIKVGADYERATRAQLEYRLTIKVDF